MPLSPFVRRVFAIVLASLLPCLAHAAENQPPQFSSAPNPVADVGHIYRYDAEAADPEGGPVQFELLQAPAAATLDAATGEFAWSPRDADVGVHTLVLQARDGEGASVDQQAELRVLEDCCPIYPVSMPRKHLDQRRTDFPRRHSA